MFSTDSINPYISHGLTVKNIIEMQMAIIQSIQNRMYDLRGERVMLDFDLAQLYEVETRVLNQSVKRNIKRFPTDFMFQLTKEEFEAIRPELDKVNQGMSSQTVMTYRSRRPNTALPYALPNKA